MIAPIVLFAVLSTISIKSAIILLICVPLIPISIIAIVQIAKRILCLIGLLNRPHLRAQLGNDRFETVNQWIKDMKTEIESTK